MAKHLIGTNEDGSARFHYNFAEDGDNFLGVALFTGPISGTLAMRDGTAYDVSENVIHCKPEHLEELKLTIHKAHHAAGRFFDVPVPAKSTDGPPRPGITAQAALSVAPAELRPAN